MSFRTINPTDESTIKEYQDDTFETIKEKIEKTHKAFLEWKATDFNNRAEPLLKIAEELRAKKNELAELMTTEMGKPITQARSEIEKSAWVCEYYAKNAAEQLKDEKLDLGKTKSYITFQPLGVILAIMPWNFPFWQVFRFVAPTLMAGNAALLKHSPNTMGCAEAIEKIFKNANVPENLLTNIVLGPGRVPLLTPEIIKHPSVKAVTLTGSSRAGAAVSSIAGVEIKKTVLELGGSDPYIILPNANVEKAAISCAVGRLVNSGQSCIAAKRMLVHKSIKAQFTEALLEKIKEYKTGNPLHEETTIGPIARKDLRDKLDGQIKESIDKGAKPLLGCEKPDGKGYFYPVSALDNVKKGAPAFDEEVFGPLAAIIEFESEEEAIELANDTPFGLGGAVFTEDLEKGETIARKMINSGAVFVNDFVSSDPRAPFGGVKHSGYGRELSSYGIKEFVNIKTISVK